MKKITLLLVLFLVLSSCEKKEAFVPDDEIPGWLKDIVNGYELSLQQNPNNPVLHGTAWVRYKWNHEYYFEYRSLISSSFAYPISFNRDTLKQCPVCLGTDYHDNKSGKQYVWKGDGYPDTDD
jgi:hypothetical protein